MSHTELEYNRDAMGATLKSGLDSCRHYHDTAFPYLTLNIIYPLRLTNPMAVGSNEIASYGQSQSQAVSFVVWSIDLIASGVYGHGIVRCIEESYIIILGAISKIHNYFPSKTLL